MRGLDPRISLRLARHAKGSWIAGSSPAMTIAVVRRLTMPFAGMNYLAVVIAAVVSWLAGAAWYGVLAKFWVAAQGKTMEEFQAQRAAMRASPAAYAPFLI